MSQKQSTGSVVWKTILIVLVVIVVLAIVAELVIRSMISNQISQSYEAPEEDVNVSFGSQPLIFGLFRGTLNEITVDVPSTLTVIEQGEVNGLPSSTVHMQDMTLSDMPVAGTLATTTELPEDYLLAVTREQLRSQVATSTDGNNLATDLVDQLGITDMTANVENQTLDVELAQGLAVVGLALTSVNGQTALEAKDAELFGIDLPPEVSDMISNALQDGLTQEAHDFGLGVEQLSIENFEVIDGGIRLTLSGQDVPLQELTN